MAIKHILELREALYSDLKESAELLHEFEAIASTKVLSPQKLSEVQDMIEPIKANYQSISYFIFNMHESMDKLYSYLDNLKKDYLDLSDSYKEIKHEVELGSMTIEQLDSIAELYRLHKDAYGKNIWFLWVLNRPKRNNLKRYDTYVNQNYKLFMQANGWNTISIQKENHKQIEKLKGEIKCLKSLDC